jgi:signal transduction histidine kinase
VGGDIVSDASARAPSRPRLGQRPRVLALFALASLPLLALAVVYLWRGVADAEAGVTEERIALARAAALAASSFVDGSLSTLEALARTRDVTTLSNPGDLQVLLDQIRQEDSIWDVLGLNDQDGWNVVLTGAQVPPRTVNVATLEFFQRVQSTGRPVVSSAFLGRIRGIPLVAIAVPVELAGGGRGVLAGSLSLDRLREELRTLIQDPSIQIAILDEVGQVFVHPDPDVAGALTSLRGRADADAVLAGEVGSRRVMGLDSVETLVAYAPVPGRGWGVLVQQPTTGAFGFVRRQLADALGLFAVAALLAGALGWYLGGRLTLLYRQERRAMARAEETLADLQEVSDESERRRRFLERLIDAAPVAITILEGPEHRYVTLNPKARETTSRAPVLGKTVAELFPEIERQGGIEMLDRVYATGEQLTGVDQPFEVDLGDRRTEVRYTTFVLARYEDVDGRPEGVIWISLDTTEAVLARRRAEQEKDEFLSTASHELKTPLSSLGLSAQMIERMLERGMIDPTRLERYTANLRVQVDRATRLIGELLDVSRVQTGHLEIKRDPVDLARLTRLAVQRERDALPENTRHELVEQTDGSEVVVAGDEARLDQVLTNLLSNAVKYSPAGGAVEVELARRDERATLRVTDHGMGIPEEERDQVFAPFTRTSVAHQSGVEGTGLGLYITRRIVEAHAGTILATDTPGGGTTFVVTLPLAAQEASRNPMQETA